MFICSECKEPIGPNIQPIIIPTGMRQVKYMYGGTGKERTGERKVCAKCALKLKFKPK